jgi:resolvase-like protein
LVHDHKCVAASLETPPDPYGLAEARMKSVGDACFSRLFVGSMSPFRAMPAARARRARLRDGVRNNPSKIGPENLNKIRLENNCSVRAKLHLILRTNCLHLHQQGIDTTTPAGKALFQMMGVFAEFVRSMIQERRA